MSEKPNENSPKVELQEFNFPDYNITILAVTRAEAEEGLKASLSPIPEIAIEEPTKTKTK